MPRRSRNARATFFQVRPFFRSSRTGRRDLAGVTVARTTDRAPATPAAVRPGWASGGSTRSLTVCFCPRGVPGRGAHGGRRWGVAETGRRGAVAGGAGRGDDEAGGDRAERRPAPFDERRCGRRHPCPCLTGPRDGIRRTSLRSQETPPGVSASSSQTPRLLSSFPTKPTFHTYPRVAEPRGPQTGPGSGAEARPAAVRHRRRAGGAVGWRRPEPGLNGERRRGSADLREEARVSLPRLLERAARPTLLLVDPAIARDVP